MFSLIFILEIIGTIAFAISGASIAIKKGMDIFGIAVLGTTTAVGGGIIRDLILGINPPLAFKNPIYAIVAIIVSLLVFSTKSYIEISEDNIVVLLMDDIQFFTGKKKSQEMFFNVFSSMINNGKQVVITSDRHPNELKDIENRLITRFAGGLPISINPPDINTSKEITKMYIAASGMDINRIDSEVFSFFAEKFSKNIRELKGAVNKLLFYTINIKKVDRVNLSNAIEAVSDFLKANESNKKLSEIKIIDVVSNLVSVTFKTV